MQNAVMLQYFHWYVAPKGGLWHELEHNAKALAEAGFDAVWIPPAYKAAGGKKDVGYAPYDLWDLGEFQQKGTVSTRYGTKKQLLSAVKAAQAVGLSVYADVVLNHRDGADKKERLRATPVDGTNRNQETGAEREVEAWTHFTFPGRKDTYSKMQWHWQHFTAASYNTLSPHAQQILRFAGKQFSDDVDDENGNYDYLMANDVDLHHPEVREELICWGKWLVATLNLDGLRLDAVKHLSAGFVQDWLRQVRAEDDHELFVMGEYWRNDVNALKAYLDRTDNVMSLFDVPLHQAFHEASIAGRDYDLRTIFDKTLLQAVPSAAVTFVENHDTQPCQSLESAVEDWFKPLAYAFILLRTEGYPCVFYGDYYGADYRHETEECDVALPAMKPILDTLLHARKQWNWGPQEDYFDHPNTIGWLRMGDKQHPQALAVVLGNGDDGSKRMCVQRPGTTFKDILGNVEAPVVVDNDGWGTFLHRGGSVSVWVEQIED